MNTKLVEVVNEQVLTTSRKVAETFEKNHKDVLRAIENIKAQNCALTTTYQAGTGKNYPEYLMNRDGFSILVMGWLKVLAIGASIAGWAYLIYLAMKGGA